MSKLLHRIILIRKAFFLSQQIQVALNHKQSIPEAFVSLDADDCRVSIIESQIGVNLSEDPHSFGDGEGNIPPFEASVGHIDAILVEIEVGKVEEVKVLVVSFLEFLVEDMQIGIGRNKNDGYPWSHVKRGFKLFHPIVI